MTIRRDDNKYTRLSKAQYDGQARNGEIVIDLDNHSVWVGDDNGYLLPIGGGSGITVVKDESIILTAAATSLNFLGAGVTATASNPLTGDVDVTIPGGIAGVVVSDEGSVIASTANSMNFVGAGVTATATGNVVTVTIPGGGSGNNTIIVKDEGLSLSLPVTAINFIGDAVSAVYNAGVADVTVTGTDQLLGTWTPVLKTNTGTGVFTYAKQEGHYVKTGRLVTCYFTIQVSAQTITTPSAIQLIGLPFTAFDTTLGLGVPQHIGNLVLDYFEFGIQPTHVSGKVLGGTTKVELYWHGLTTGPNAYIAQLNNDNLTFPDQDYVMIGTITYIREADIPPDPPPR
jgi:hypothetical protein